MWFTSDLCRLRKNTLNLSTVVCGDSRNHISRLRPSAGPQGISTSGFFAVQYSPTADLNSAWRLFDNSVLVGTSRVFFTREGFTSPTPTPPPTPSPPLSIRNPPKDSEDLRNDSFNRELEDFHAKYDSRWRSIISKFGEGLFSSLTVLNRGRYFAEVSNCAHQTPSCSYKITRQFFAYSSNMVHITSALGTSRRLPNILEIIEE